MKEGMISVENKIILDLCGGTGAWSRPYKDAGYDVRNITLPEYDIMKTELDESDILIFKGKKTLYLYPEKIYGVIAAPPCTMFSIARTNAKKPRNLKGSMDLVLMCLKIIWICQYQIKGDNQRKPPLKFWALENPKGLLEWFLGKPTYQFQPYEFGDNYSKKTCLWGNFNEPSKLVLMQAQKAKRSMSDLVTPMSNNRDFKKVAELRAITPPGFAKAFFEANR